MSGRWHLLVTVFAAVLTAGIALWMGTGWRAAPIASAAAAAVATLVSILRLAPYLVVADFVPIADYSLTWLQPIKADSNGVLEIRVLGYIKSGSILGSGSLDKCVLNVHAGGSWLPLEAGRGQFPDRFERGRQSGSYIVFRQAVRRGKEPDLEWATAELVVKGVSQIRSSRYQIKQFRLNQSELRMDV